MEITPDEVKAKIEAGEALRIVDVREPYEFAICSIEGSELMPMASIPQKWRELDDAGPLVVVLCHHGVRSLSVVDWLRRQGLANCASMSGGIDLWSLTVDPSVPRY